tara:strand:+ start:1767 stop:2117 length:351 start_codon:yes stop_codon:yes gene_type:complete
MKIPAREVSAPLPAPRWKMEELEAEKLVAKLVDKVDLSYPRAVKDKSINLQTALAIGVVKAMLKMAEKEGLSLKQVESLDLMQLMLDLISADRDINKGEILDKYLQHNSIYLPPNQ